MSANARIALANKVVEKAIMDKKKPWKETWSVLDIFGSFGCSKLFHTFPCRSRS